MTYEKSFKIGSQADGYILCNHIIVMDADGNKLFSFNRSSYNGYRRIVTNEENALEYLRGVHGDVSDVDPNANFKIEVEYPLVSANAYIEGAELLPVLLTQEAARFIQSKLQALKQKKYRVYRVYDNYAKEGDVDYKPGDRRLMQETYTKPVIVPKNTQNSALLLKVNGWKDTDIYHHEVETETVDQPHYATLRDICDNYKTAFVYVRPENVDWIPAKVDLVLADEIEAARKKMENAKSLLIAAGAASLIL